MMHEEENNQMKEYIEKEKQNQKMKDYFAEKEKNNSQKELLDQLNKNQIEHSELVTKKNEVLKKTWEEEKQIYEKLKKRI